MRAPGAFTAIELLRIQAQHIKPETDGALGEAGFCIEDEVLCPLFCLGLRIGRVGEVTVEVGVAQVKCGRGVIDKTVGLGVEGQGDCQAAEADKTETRRERAGELTHSEAPFRLLFLLFVVRRRTTLGEIFARFSGSVKQKLYDDYA